MAKNKKRRNFNTSTRQNSESRSAPVTLRDKKKELIKKRIHSDEKKSNGMRAAGIILAALMLTRVALFVYELIFSALAGLSINVISNLLLLPLLILVYMVHDGNRGLIGVCAASAIVRIIYLFTSVYPTLEGVSGGTAFLCVYLAVMALQFIMSTVVLSMPSIALYCEEMRKINYELRSHIVTK